MKLSKMLSVVAAAAVVFAFAGSGIAKVSKDDTQMVGKVTRISGKSLTIETIGEKSPQTFDMNILDNAMVMQSDNGKILKVSDIKTGQTVNIYCWNKGGTLYARMIWIETVQDYLTKAILKDAKDGKPYKGIDP